MSPVKESIVKSLRNNEAQLNGQLRLMLQPSATVLSKETSAAPVPFAAGVRAASWLNMSLHEVQ